MTYRLNAFFAWFNRLNSALLIFILCMANYIGYYPSGGEEQYFAFAKQFMDPTWMPHSFTLNHPAGGNLVFQVIAGFILKFISFEQLTLWGRTTNFILYAIPLSLIFRKLRITNIEILFLLQVLFFGHQSLYAGEWIFNSLEEKTLAYVFVFWSVYFLLMNKVVHCSIFAAVATYFHFLVGGWIFAFIILFFIFRTRKISPVIGAVMVYIAITMPFVVYLYKTYMTGNPAVVNGVDTNIVYAFWRLKHHIGIVQSMAYFIHKSVIGVMITFVLFGLCVFKFNKIKKDDIQLLNLLNIIMFSQQFLFLFIEIFDKNAVLAKTYPFRTNSLSVFLFLTECVLVARYHLSKKAYPAFIQKMGNMVYPLRKFRFSVYLNSFLLLTGLFVLGAETMQTVNKFSENRDLDADMTDLVKYVRENTPGSAVFIFPDGDKPYSFIRTAERERFVVEKFTPTRSVTIYEWYKRARIKERLKENISLIDSVRTAYQVDYLVTDSAYTWPSLNLEKEFGSHYLYKISK